MNILDNSERKYEKMKHCFLINPAAGKGKQCAETEKSIIACCEAAGLDFDIYYTAGVGDAEEHIKAVCSEADPATEFCFYAAGGDGTFSEVVNGAVHFANASVGLIPIGTGNDFVRNFTNPTGFFDISAQIEGSEIALDLIKFNDRYSSNMLNTGFDCEVCRRVAKIKRNPAIPSKLAYLAGALIELIRKPGAKFEVSVDGGEVRDLDLLLTCICNGAFCGGGFHSGPYADIADGVLDVCFIKNVTRLKFLKLLTPYKNGTYLSADGIEEIAEYIKCQRLDIKFKGFQSVCIDGEIEELEDMSISVAPGALRFRLPRGCELIRAPKMSETETKEPVEA